MQESNADTRECEVKRLNNKCTQNWRELRESKCEITHSIKNSKSQQEEQCQNASNKNPNNEKEKEEITQQSLKMSSKKQVFKTGLW